MNRVALNDQCFTLKYCFPPWYFSVVHCDSLKKKPCTIVVLLWKFPQKETHIEETQAYVWRGLETAPTANKSRIKSHSAMISLTLNYEGWQNSGPSIPLYTHSQQRLKESHYKNGVVRVLYKGMELQEFINIYMDYIGSKCMSIHILSLHEVTNLNDVQRQNHEIALKTHTLRRTEN